MSGCEGTNSIDRWLCSGKSARIVGLDLMPVAHPVLTDTAQCVVKGQASVFFLREQTHGSQWLLKKFAPSRQPTDAYLEAVQRCLPGGAAFFTCTQRRLLTAGHYARWQSAYNSPELAVWLEGTILMPKVPGMPWACIADGLRAGELQLAPDDRLKAAISLADCVSRLEVGGCSHRDFSCGNVFVDGIRVYVIDWDSLYHVELPFQPNTTVGTLGYLAPFLRHASDRWSAQRSWRLRADRFALAVLIAEFLLVSSERPETHEDGSFFAQDQLGDSSHEFVRRQVQALKGVSSRVAVLFEAALGAQSFEDCSSPDHWQAVLRQTLNYQQREYGRQHASRPRIPCGCAQCGAIFLIAAGRLSELVARDKPALCGSCFQTQIQAWSASRSLRDQAYPQVACEHCQTPLRIARTRLEALRAQARPLLCRECLVLQLGRWQAEQVQRERELPRITCASCRKEFRIRRQKLTELQAMGKSLLCWSCLTTKLQARAICGTMGNG